jgi:hypothetical protein
MNVQNPKRNPSDLTPWRGFEPTTEKITLLFTEDHVAHMYIYTHLKPGLPDVLF